MRPFDLLIVISQQRISGTAVRDSAFLALPVTVKGGMGPHVALPTHGDVVSPFYPGMSTRTNSGNAGCGRDLPCEIATTAHRATFVRPIGTLYAPKRLLAIRSKGAPVEIWKLSRSPLNSRGR